MYSVRVSRGRSIRGEKGIVINVKRVKNVIIVLNVLIFYLVGINFLGMVKLKVKYVIMRKIVEINV